jgi:predicted ArsR family transcriptional regulator
VATLYQMVKTTLKAMAPVTYPRLAEQLEADEDAVRLALVELKKRGKARIEVRRSNKKGELWQWM